LEFQGPEKAARCPVASPSPFEDPIAVAMVDVAAERGYEAASVELVAARAGVTLTEFRRRFRDKEECALRSFEAFADDMQARFEDAYYAQRDWRTGLRAAAYELADWIEENPNLVRFGVVEVLKAENEMMRVRREEAVSIGARLIDMGRGYAAENDIAVPDGAALMALGSIVQLLTHRLQTATDLAVSHTVPQMLFLVTRPYVGEERAREELTRPRPVRPPHSSAAQVPESRRGTR
jgi:AcrR family transcriptional regulator